MKNTDLQELLSKFPDNGKISFQWYQHYGEPPMADILVDDEVVFSEAMWKGSDD